MLNLHNTPLFSTFKIILAIFINNIRQLMRTCSQ
ncbi:hypothetical protein BB2000_2124 [Proteus mirabilis BB2000]|nr:hypothetical protein BB2000_2124 [Proteus mirabilis BB2000]